MKCPHCGTVNRWEATRCEKCGTFLGQDTEQVSGQNTDQDDLERSIIKEWPAPEPPPDVPLNERPPKKPALKTFDPYYHKKFPALLYGGYVAAVIVILIVLTFVVIGPKIDITGNGNQTTITNPLAGTWGTSEATTFFVKTNWPSGNMTDLGQENRTVSLVITGTDYPDTVNVAISYRVIDSNISSAAMYGTETTPGTFQGKVNGTTLTIDQAGLIVVFSFDAATMTGTWDHTITFPFFTEEVHTGVNALTLVKLPI